MDRKERGLPAQFGLSIAEETVKRTPVALDDYLEREIGGQYATSSVASRPATRPAEPVRRVQADAEAQPTVPNATYSRAFQSVAASQQTSTCSHRFRTRPAPIKTPRVQLNMTPEVQRMVQEVVGQFCAFGLQKDTSASEVFEALVGALHEARDKLDLSDVPPRGQWGTPTARAFRTSLKNAVTAAIARHAQRLTA